MLCYTVYMYHMFINYSSVEGHMTCFHFPTIVNRAAMNMADIHGIAMIPICELSSPLGTH